MKELRRYLVHGAFDILPYTHAYNHDRRAAIWNSIKDKRGGLPKCRRIILATTSVSTN